MTAEQMQEAADRLHIERTNADEIKSAMGKTVEALEAKLEANEKALEKSEDERQTLEVEVKRLRSLVEKFSEQAARGWDSAHPKAQAEEQGEAAVLGRRVRQAGVLAAQDPEEGRLHRANGRLQRPAGARQAEEQGPGGSVHPSRES